MASKFVKVYYRSMWRQQVTVGRPAITQGNIPTCFKIWKRRFLDLRRIGWTHVTDSVHEHMKCMADSRTVPSQWETPLQSNAVSHWLGANLESALKWLSGEYHGTLQMEGNIGSGNGLVPTGITPLHEPMLTQIYVAYGTTRPQWVQPVCLISSSFGRCLLQLWCFLVCWSFPSKQHPLKVLGTVISRGTPLFPWKRVVGSSWRNNRGSGRRKQLHNHHRCYRNSMKLG